MRRPRAIVRAYTHGQCYVTFQSDRGNLDEDRIKTSVVFIEGRRADTDAGHGDLARVLNVVKLSIRVASLKGVWNDRTRCSWNWKLVKRASTCCTVQSQYTEDQGFRLFLNTALG